MKARKAVLLRGQVWTGASGKAGGGQAKEDEGWVVGAHGCRGAHIPLGHGSPERVPLLLRGRSWLGLSKPSRKNVTKGKLRTTGTVMKGKGSSSTTYRCKIAA